MTKCPICREAAEQLPTETRDAESFDCPTDGPFRVAATIKLRLEALDLEGRKAALESARRLAAPGETPMINDYSFSL